MSSVTEATLALARQGDRAAFDRLVGPHRGELRAHCYRMLGSMQDADDALQESLLGAWRGIASFEGRSAMRSWLYTIATHACLRLIDRRPPRRVSSDMFPPRDDTAELGDPVPGPVFLEPWIDGTEPAQAADDPAASVLKRESVELAFVAALQHLPGTQRAAVVLCDVLEFSAAEAARALDTTVAALNSALQRGRKAVSARASGRTQQEELAELGTAGERELVRALVSAWERADVPGLMSLLSEGARFTMPPLPAWFSGREAVGRFFAERVFATPWRLTPIRANGQLGFACYMASAGSDRFQLSAVNVISLSAGKVCWIAGFLDPALHHALGLPATLDQADENRFLER